MKATKVIKAVRAVKAKNTGKQKARRRLTTRVTGLLLAALAPALLLPGAAVSAQELPDDYRRDTLELSENYVEILQILGEMNGNIALNNGDPFPLDAAVKEIALHKADFIAALENNTLRGAIESFDRYSWHIPIVEGDYFSMATVSYAGGDFGPSTMEKRLIENCQYEYIARPQVVQQLLEEHNLADAEYIQAFKAFNIYTSFIYVEKQGRAYLIPFVERQDFSPVVHKQVYPYEQARELLLAAYGNASNGTASIGAAKTLETVDISGSGATALFWCGSACILAACVLTITRLLRRRG